jgi:NitT/TauT family transport system substrate-binding protein
VARLTSLLGGAVAAAWALNAAAAPAPAPRIVLAVDGVEQTRNLPALLAERLGYFRDEGLTVTLVDAPAQPSPAELMKDGRADGAVAFYHHTFMSQANDHVVTEAVATLGVTPALKLMVATRLRDRVKTAADLKGLRIFTGGPNSGKTTATNWLVQHAGLSLDSYQPLKPTNARQMAQALASGEADAVMAHEPDASEYAAAGVAFELADLASPQGTRAALGEVFPSTSLYMPRAYVDAHPGEVQRLVRALVRANAFIRGHDAAAIADVLPAHAVGKDRAAFLKLLAADKQMFETDGRISVPAARAEWQAMTALTPKYGRIDFAATYTNRFVDAAGGR